MAEDSTRQGSFGDDMLRPSPNHGTQRLPNDEMMMYIDPLFHFNSRQCSQTPMTSITTQPSCRSRGGARPGKPHSPSVATPACGRRKIKLFTG